MIHALNSWKHYLLGTPLIIKSDHQSIKYFITQTKLSVKQMRWANFLSQFSFHLTHIARKHNLVVDALSKRPMTNAITMSHHHELTSMSDDYVNDEDYGSIMANISNDISHKPYSLKDGFLLHGS